MHVLQIVYFCTEYLTFRVYKCVNLEGYAEMQRQGDQLSGFRARQSGFETSYKTTGATLSSDVQFFSFRDRFYFILSLMV